MAAVETAFRWSHVVAGVLWVGLGFALEQVGAPFLAALESETRRRVLRELMPRALFLLRFAALYAWGFGVLLLFLLYYTAGDSFHRPLTPNAGLRPELGAWASAFTGAMVGFVVYDALVAVVRRLPRAAGPIVGALGLGTLVLGYAGALIELAEASHRCAYIHVGALLGTVMAANVWLRIWPAWRRVLAALAAEREPDPRDTALAAERNRHNAYLSAPLVLLMLSVHLGWLLGHERWYVVLGAILVVGATAVHLVSAKVKRVSVPT